MMTIMDKCSPWIRFLVWVVIGVLVSVSSASDDDHKPENSAHNDMRYSGAPDFHDNEVPRSGLPVADDCAILNQVQSVVIQILNTHYEYGKGIHMLHNIVTGIQDDFSVLKDGLDTLTKRVNSSAAVIKPTEFGFDPAMLRTSNGMARTLHGIYNSLRNLTATVTKQGAQYQALDKKYIGIRRKLKKTLGGNALLYGDNDINKGAEVDHYMKKQTDINAKLLRRVQILEQSLEKRQERQGDSPSVKGMYGCPEGFLRHFTSCYKFHNETASWIDAEKQCQGFHSNAHLVSIETREEAEYLVQYRIHNRVHWASNYIWTGGNDMPNEGQWRWVGTGAAFTYTNWRPGQPDNHNEDQHCVYLRADGADPRWDDWHCHAARLNYVCEINMGGH